MTRNNTRGRTPKIGDVYLMMFDGSGSEQAGLRPGVVFQNNTGNIHSPNLIALPMTTNLKKQNMPTHVLINASEGGLAKDSIVICENPQRISKEKIGRYITSLSVEDMKRIARASLIATSAISFLDLDTLIDTWQKSVQLNERFEGAANGYQT